MERLRQLTSTLLDPQNSACSLRPEVVEITGILEESSEMQSLSEFETIDANETRTSNGLAVSPTMAAMCAADFVRTIKFMRGVHAAIDDVRKQFPDRPARVLYAGCGPYATLAVPVMTQFCPPDVTFTLLDLHPKSIASVRSIVGTLGLDEFVADFKIADAASYRIPPNEPPDIIVTEVMQACLEVEPQVAVTHHLLKQAPDAILIPKQISIDLKLVDISHEFYVADADENEPARKRKRVSVGSVFVLDREAVRSWDDKLSDRLPASTVQIPDFTTVQYQPLLFTTICTYQDHVIISYESGLTCPRHLSLNGSLQPGDLIQFHYETGVHPRLVAEPVLSSDREDSTLG